MPNVRKSRAKRTSTPIDFNRKRIKLSTEDKIQTSNDIVVQNDTSLVIISEKLLLVERNLCTELEKITFRFPIEYVYNPIEYAFDVHALYVQKYGNSIKRILFLGMNPGPWGMSQTGVPFGEISMVRDWLKISGTVGKPAKEQPDRKITGFDCTRSEVSGKRFWGLFKELCGSPEKFFEHAYLHNYCPFALMDKKGKNITPAEIKGVEQQTLHSACDKALNDIIQLLNVQVVIGIGKYAEKRAQIAVQQFKLPVQVLCLPHPSPRALKNENWNEKAAKKLDEFGLLDCFTK